MTACYYYLFIYLFIIIIIICYYLYIVKLVTKNGEIKVCRMARRQNIVGQSSDFEVYPGVVWEPVKLNREVGRPWPTEQKGRMTRKMRKRFSICTMSLHFVEWFNM